MSTSTDTSKTTSGGTWSAGAARRRDLGPRRNDPTLGRYFHDLSEHDVLDSETEADAARQIAELEAERWCVILSNPTCAGEIADLLRRELRADESYEDTEEVEKMLSGVKRSATTVRRRKTSAAGLERAATAVACRLCDLDLRRDLVTAAHDLAVQRGTRKRGGALKRTTHARAVEQVRARVEQAKHRFIRANLRLVVAIARRYDRGQMPLIDLIQEGNLGLIKAVDRFDYRRGFRFSTYASWWIRHAIGRALADKGQAVRVPVHALDTQHRLARATEQIALQLGRPPTDEELIEATGLDRRKLKRVRKHTVAPIFSLDREVSDGDDRRYIDLLADENARDPFDDTVLRSWLDGMEDVLEVLTPMERSIIRWRYGLDDGEELTLKQIGDHYDLSRERIRQLQQQALRKIRRHLELDAA